MTDLEKFRAAGEAIRSYHRGDELGDDELKNAMRLIPKVLEFLKGIGPEYSLFYKSLNTEFCRFEGILHARMRPGD